MLYAASDTAIYYIGLSLIRRSFTGHETIITYYIPHFVSAKDAYLYSVASNRMQCVSEHRKLIFFVCAPGIHNPLIHTTVRPTRTDRPTDRHGPASLRRGRLEKPAAVNLRSRRRQQPPIASDDSVITQLINLDADF